MDWLSLLIFPVIVVIIGLFIEYFVIQPIRKSNAIPIPASVDRDWSNAIRKAIKEFQAQQSGYANESIINRDRSKKVKIDECTVHKGRAVLIVSLSYIGVSEDKPSIIGLTQDA